MKRTLLAGIGYALVAFFLTSAALFVFSDISWMNIRLDILGGKMFQFFMVPSVLSLLAFMFHLAHANPARAEVSQVVAAVSPSTAEANPQQQPFMVQVVGLQWLNPLQRRDYPTEWQLLWTLGLTTPNKNDDMVKSDPKLFSSLQAVTPIAAGSRGKETFQGYHHKYIHALVVPFRIHYFTKSSYFFNAHSRDRKDWRELAGIRVHYALPQRELDPHSCATYLRDRIAQTFDIGNPNFPNAWTRSTAPDVRVHVGGANAGFTSLSAALDYLHENPHEVVWVMNWDAPSRPKDTQINENMVLLVLAGKDFKTEREPLGWIGYPASSSASEFEVKKGLPPRRVQAWQKTLSAAVKNGNKRPSDIGYVIHDANNTHAESSQRLGTLAQTLSTELPEFDFIKQTFNTPALLGEMGAGTALTNVALAIAYANHMGKHVLVAGTSDQDRPTAVLVTPPANVRSIKPDEPWFRARSEAHAYLPWWGLRHDLTIKVQGYSE